MKNGVNPQQPTYSHPLVHLHPPAWACAWGEDSWGVFADFLFGEVEQRMRWIPEGTFWMGSPETESGRWERERSQRLVTLTRGFWLGETPCTQALWEAVMGTNPSQFVSPDRPVEQVSWEECQEFLARLEGAAPQLRFRLPTEAEWEYACRAGSEATTWKGDLEILGERNAPLLDEIAWYGGNSGVGFELESGRDSSDWEETQYPHERAGTRRVGERSPNPWGLYDMLGNVFEWCQDRLGIYEGAEAVDPVGPPEESLRVIRGGSWLAYARDVRAAYRVGFLPGHRDDDLGFRLARGPGA